MDEWTPLPKTSTLSIELKPSSFVSSWFTTLSWTADAVKEGH